MRLPPLNALRAFEAAARHGGFIGASDELCVTRGAISRHVKLLEEHLGVQLFLRQAQGVKLTAAGRRLLPVLTDAFGRIAAEAGRISADAAELRVICPPATSIRWLLPRLEEFRSRHPEIRIRLTTDFHGDGGFDGTEYDIGFSVEHWHDRAPGLQTEVLFPGLMTPACAPGLLEDRAPVHEARDLAALPLLHETAKRLDWRAWIDEFAARDLDPSTGHDFPNLDIATKAAVMGAGIVMADLVLCREELESGTLVAPLPDLVCASPFGGVCLIGPREKWNEPKVAAFREWAVDRAARDGLPV